jgi:hypothetical protein
METVSTLYNLGACYGKIAAYMKLDGEGIKEACKLFQVSATCFEKLKTVSHFTNYFIGSSWPPSN